MAKDLVLDLLGWGGVPEYLVEGGLSREIVYFVFRELNLRLPANLDTNGLVPYGPTSTSTSTTRTRVETTAMTLHDMEQQRRQELLARKAVQASRKAKVSSPAPPDKGEEVDVEMVEDFLKSIPRTKRPVAADFVDVEGPRGKVVGGSFASVSGMRRCVIDLSDSEDDPGSLMEKEEEIRKMREMIAERELKRNIKRRGECGVSNLI